MGASNVLASAGTGAAAGTSIAPGWGTAIGAGVGLLTGLLGEYESAESEAEKRKILEQAAAKLGTSYNETKQMLDEYYENNDSIGTSADVDKYKSLVSGYDPNEFVYDYDEFNDDYDVNDYYAANKDAIIQKTSDALQATAAGAGIGRGTGAANQIATGVAEKNEDLYKDALEAMNSDRNFAYNLWNSNIQNAQNRLNALNQSYQTQTSLYGNLAEDYQNWNQNKTQQYLDAKNNYDQNQLNLTLAGI